MSGVAPDDSPTHALVLSALALLFARWKAARAAAPQLGQAVALATRALDPARPALRQGCLQPAASLLQQLAAAFPQVALHPGSLQLAYGTPYPLAQQQQQGQQQGEQQQQRSGRSSGGGAAAGSPEAAAAGAGAGAARAGSRGGSRGPSGGGGPEEAGWVPSQQVLVIVYDLHTGQQRRLLAAPYAAALPPPRQGAAPLDAPAAGAAREADGAGPVPPACSGVACAAFSPSGELVAALLHAACCVAVWRPAGGLAAKLGLSRGPASLLPAALLRLPEAALAGGARSSGSGGGAPEEAGGLELGLRLLWQSERRVEVLRGGQRVASLELNA
jgi:hypothetical protein